MLVAGEASAEGEGDLGLRAGPGGVAHAVAPGVEVGALDGVLRPVHHHVPAAEVVGDHVVEAVGVAVPHMDRHDAPVGMDVVEMAGG